jgi:metal-sulfur cluster biosynthetic enzyme
VREAYVRDPPRGVLDPEVGVNIVDLGLVYGVHTDSTSVQTATTMTVPARPLRDYLLRAL